MRLLIIGSGAREHAVAWKFANSNRVSGLYIAPGNAGTAEIGTNIDIDPFDFDQVISVCKEHSINYVFVGPEAPLSAGIVDAVQKAGINIIGPHKEAAQLEASKTFSKNFMLKHNVPTAMAKEFNSIADFEDYINNSTSKLVIKKNGLAAGKGVLESDDKEILLNFGRNVLKNDTLLVEEFLSGYEISIFALYDGNTYLTLPPCADFKKAGEDDTGLNTGGMGSICPVPWVDKNLMEQIRKEIIEPTFEGIKKEKLNYKGILYFGLMITDDGPKVIEYNVRLGDPETQALLPLVKVDFGNLMEAMVEGSLETYSDIISSQDSAVCVVIASEGYPGDYIKGVPVELGKKYNTKEVCLFHASTTMDESKTVYTGGGRCFSIVGIGKDTMSAASSAYENIDIVKFQGSWYRSDIGRKFFIDL